MTKLMQLTIFLCILAVLQVASPKAIAGNLVDEEHQIFIAEPLITEPAWIKTGAYLKSFLFDIPNATSRPAPQVGFVFTPGFTWAIMDILELNIGFPLVINPDATGVNELDAAVSSPSMKSVPTWDNHPDFDLPGLLIGLKASLLGKEAKDRLFLAVGVNTNLPIFEEWATNFTPPKNSPYQSAAFRIDPYVSLAYGYGRFAPQLQLGASIRPAQKVFNPDKYAKNPSDPNGAIAKNSYMDLFFNLALPFAFPYEGTVPMIEFNGVWNPQKETAQLVISPAISFLPKGSPALLGFACMIPIMDSEWRNNEGIRVLVNFSYQLDMLSIPGFGSDESGDKDLDETPPANW